MGLFFCALLLVSSCLIQASPLNRINEPEISKRNDLEPEENIMDHISSVNVEVQDVFEGDIILVGDEADVDLRNEGDVDRPLTRRRKRSAERDRTSLWPGRVVPFVINSSLTWATNGIMEAIEEFHNYSCLTFKERTSEDNYLHFVAKDGCWSSVGREFWSTSGQEVSLGSGCYNKGIIMHEIMHALGFWHEQSRPDRNLYVEVLWENIQTGEEFNFNKYNHGKIDNMGVPYDMDSVMHYGRKSFSKNDLPTLRSIIEPERGLGQRTGFTQYDIQKLNSLYDCTSEETEGWSSWTSYGPCDTKCGKTRQRYCLSTDYSTCPGANSYGTQTETSNCTQEECYAPIDGHWGRWSSWSSCSESCGLGNQTRERLCDDPSPANEGTSCPGDSTMTQDCILIRCGLGPDDCEFDDLNMGPWNQDTTDNTDWVRISGGTVSANTGPSADHTSGTGSYMYLESSSPLQPGQTARLKTNWLEPVSSRCLQFAYHMYGATTGTLRVKMIDYVSFTQTTLWTLSGDQGNAWHTAKADISSENKYYLIIEAEKGSSYTGDIAIDDVYFKEHACDYIPPSTQAPTAKELPIGSLGCWKNSSPRIFPNLLQNLRNNINWQTPTASADNIKDNCYQKAVGQGLTMFGIEFYGECWGPGSSNSTVDYQKHGAAEGCWHGVGASNKVNVYQII
uniref:Metalloendopeptidase n=1 Tax=Pachycerianthus maua TaxID=2736681 RepID=A0A7G7WYT7_9CNID|nr:toxin candidate TRINITY_DN37054_c0_g1_i2 [Pachycerianthus maua]